MSPDLSVTYGRFCGGYIAGHHGAPDNHVCTVQRELAQHHYRDEEDLRYDAGKADRPIDTIRKLLQALEAAANPGMRTEGNT